MLGLLLLVVCLSTGFILFLSDAYKFLSLRIQMTDKKEKDAEKCPDYCLKLYKFDKIYETPGGLSVPRPESFSKDPIPRSGHRIECTDTCLYSIGGFHPKHREKLLCEVWRFDFATRTWTNLKTDTLSKELASCSTVLSGNVLFLYGGTGHPFGQHLNESLYFCHLPKHGDDSITFAEINLTTMTCPTARYGHSMALNDHYLYVVGGTTGHMYSMDVHEFNLKTREWNKLYDYHNDPDGPQPRYRHEMICYNNRLYIFGGGTSHQSFSLRTIPAYNLKTKQWETFKTIGDDAGDGPNFPRKRKCHGCVQDPNLPSVVFVNGGQSRQDSAFGDTWRIDLDKLKWTRIQSLTLPYGTYFHSIAATPDGRMLLFGGLTDKYTPAERTADLYSAWISVPRLDDACWEAVLHYVRNGVYTIPQNIKMLGLPPKYENRLISSSRASA